ncbi:MAG: hypothetical protein WBR15_00955 [Gammaproteobacteria bacterium]
MNTQLNIPICPICRVSPTSQSNYQGDAAYIICPNCGYFSLTRNAIDRFEMRPLTWMDSAKLSHWVRETDKPKITSNLLENLLRDLPSITVPMQVDNLIMLLGKRYDSAKTGVIVDSYPDLALVGAQTPQDLNLLVHSVCSEGLIMNIGDFLQPPDSNPIIHGSFPRYRIHTQLTLKGWELYDELTRAKIDSQMGFMAFEFEDVDAESLYKHIYKPAAKEVGFDLYSLIDNHRPGLIDEKLKVELRRAAFIIAEITTRNSNVLWEAGFAEALGKPVIYSCRTDKWDDVRKYTFDTNHMYTIIWDMNVRDKAAEKLKDTLRETYPSRTN